jgi:hypothetical protein
MRQAQASFKQSTGIHLSGQGSIFSYTVVTDPPAGFEAQSPYVLAIVQLDEGPLVTAQITDLPTPTGPVEIGQRVEMVTRKLRTEGDQGMIIYGYKFRPVLV